MTFTLNEICIFHLYTISPMQMLRFTAGWDLKASLEYRMSLARGNSLEREAADALSAADVYRMMRNYLSEEGRYADEDVMGAYHMDQKMYAKLRRYLYGESTYKLNTV